MKGITPVIATIMLLLITISMVGFAYIWLSNIWKGTTTGTENMANQQAQRMGQKISIESAKTIAITVRNIGTYSIPKASLAVFVDSVHQDCDWDRESFAPGDTITTTSGFACSAGQTVKVTAPGNFDLDACAA